MSFPEIDPTHDPKFGYFFFNFLRELFCFWMNFPENGLSHDLKIPKIDDWISYPEYLCV